MSTEHPRQPARPVPRRRSDPDLRIVWIGAAALAVVAIGVRADPWVLVVIVLAALAFPIGGRLRR